MNTLLVILIFLLALMAARHLYHINSLTTQLQKLFSNEVTDNPVLNEKVTIKEKKKNPAFAFGIVVLAVCGFFTFFANTIPQVEFHPPKKVEISSELTGEQLVKIGKGIFEGKGTCLLCHTINGDGLRAPDLAGVGERAGKRKEGYSSEDYFFESLFFPPKYVVQGYAPSMPPMHKPPAQLSVEEMVAVIAFLQSMGGEITVTGKTKPDFEKIGKP